MIQDLADAFLRYFRLHNQQAEIADAWQGLIIIEAPGGAFEFLSSFAGQYVIQRIPPTESKGRRHTSILSVAVLPVYDSETVFDKKDVRTETFASGGPGGANVNCVNSGVRVIHIPTGLKVEIRARDQFKNKMIALNILAQRVKEKEENEKSNSKHADRMSQISLGGRGGRSFKLDFIRQRIDNEISGKSGDLRKFMRGNLEVIM